MDSSTSENLLDPATSPSSLGSYQEPQGYVYQAPDHFGSLQGINPGALYGGPSGVGGVKPGPDYLQYDIRGRGWTEQMFFTVGTTYLASICFGGAFGFVEGLRTSPSNKFKIRLNSVLNRMGKRGSAAGNALGSLALIYSLSGAFYENLLESDRFFDRMISNRTVSELSTPAIAGLSTGLIYKSTMGPKTMVLAGLIGATFAVSFEAAKKKLNIH